MGKQVAKKITWVIKSFSTLPPAMISSDQFEVGGCKWCLTVYPKGNNVDYLSMYLEVANYGSLPSGWRRHAKFAFTIVNKLPEKIFKLDEYQLWFGQNAFSWGLTSMFPLDKLHAKDGGFLVNNELKIVAEVNVLEVIGKLDVTEETSTIMETMDVNGFQLLPAQAKYVSCVFERHPEIATEFRPKNPNLRKGYMSLLLSLIETMCQLPQEISKDDLCDAYVALSFMRYAGFKLDWLEKKLDELSENKEKDEEACETHMQAMEEELKDLKQKWLDMKTLVEKEKAKVSAAKASLSFDDVV